MQEDAFNEWSVPTNKDEWAAFCKLLDDAQDLKKNASQVLVKAAESLQWEIVDSLIEMGVNINAVLEDGELKGASTLWLACYNQQRELVKKLIEKGANVDVTLKVAGIEEMSSLYVAAMSMNLDIVEYLLAAGANPTVNPKSAIHKESTQSLIDELKLCRFATISNDDIMHEIPNIAGYLSVSYYCHYLLSLIKESQNKIISDCLSKFEKQLILIEKTGRVDAKESTGMIEKALKELINEPVTFSGGWNNESNSTGGHQIISQLQYDDENNLIITIFNSGQGRQMHAPSREDPKRTANSSVWKIPNTTKLTSESIRALIESLSRRNLNGDSWTAYYENVFMLVESLGGDFVMRPENSIYTVGQRGGTCTWKSLMTFLQSAINDKKEYQLLKFEIKLDVLLKFYSENSKTLGLNHNAIEDKFIYEACKNLERLIEKIQRQGELSPLVEERIKFGTKTIKEIISRLQLVSKSAHDPHGLYPQYQRRDSSAGHSVPDQNEAASAKFPHPKL